MHVFTLGFRYVCMYGCMYVYSMHVYMYVIINKYVCMCCTVFER